MINVTNVAGLADHYASLAFAQRPAAKTKKTGQSVGGQPHHTDAGEALTPEAVRAHLDSLPSVADSMSPKSVELRGYAAKAAALAESW